MNPRAEAADWEEPRVLSSRLTYFYKYVVSSIFLAVVALMTIGSLLAGPGTDGRGGGLASGGACVIPLLFMIPGTVIVLWYSASLKEVRLSGNDLLISNFREEIRVPLHSVQKVEDMRRVNPPLVVLEFRVFTPFGHKVSFLPKQELFSFRAMQFWKPSQVVLELRRRVEESGGYLDE